MKRLLEICNKYKRGEIISFEEIRELAYTNIEYVEENFEIIDNVKDIFFDLMDFYGKKWNDCDESNPNIPWHIGYVLENKVFIIGYAGDVENDWNNSGYYRICK